MKIHKLQILSFCVVLTLFFSCQGTSDKRIIKLGHGLGITHPVHEAMLFLAEKVAEKSGGKMVVKIYPNQQLGSERELVELLQIGSLGMTKVSSAALEGFAPTMQVFGMPYLFRDDAHQLAVLEGEIGKKLLLDPQKFLLRGLCYYDSGKRSFYTKTKPVETPADLAGLKIRVMESNTASNMVKALGGSPTPVSYGELYTALQQGIVDGAENNAPSLYTSKHYEVCKYYSIDEHTALPDVMIVSTKVWESLNEQEQQWLQDAADESAIYEYKIWAEATEHALSEMQKAGVIISYPDKEPFRQAVESMYSDLKVQQPEIYKIVEQIRAVK
ncbi:tripartite ATP-independent transporter DctP family solute receptor [Algoriphagus ratkowskyi]|uniref:TRAP transporter substrate-binding protein n=1 Tax=Algoriphagus ratkowskyi TaxID=57028 RepID=A0A2W7S1U3_9BACT|nr:TRAP transporter substrate-binding protein [Algoriphagus ratkowskyi]PZX61317.1 tripartite ATP-independent transporter DctP family solute receptor [Algoriphagus ratkowskyi]TXD79423.1 TRAP transporter substrate-binding protein [Algoriphagus ratkowskyi]